MKKNYLCVISLILTICIAVFFVACNKKDVNNFYTVTFDSKGGSTGIITVNVIKNTKVKEPEEPTKRIDSNEYTFLGWYCNDELWDFDNLIIYEITLEAKWQEPEEIHSKPLPIRP